MVPSRIHKLTYFDALCFGMMVSLTESFALVFFIRHNASPVWLGIVSTLPILIGAIAQVVAPFLISKRFYKTGLLASIAIQVAGIAVLILNVAAFDTWMFLTALILYWTGGSVAAPLWLAWFSKWLPATGHGEYYSRRSGFANGIMLACYMSGAYLIYALHESPRAFLFVFALGCLARVCSFVLIIFHRWQKSPQTEVQKTPDLSYAPPKNPAPFIVLILYFLFFRSMVGVASPFFLPYMFNDLHFTIVQYSFVSAIPLLTRWLFLANWGKVIDRVSTLDLVVVTGFGIALIPFLWALAPSIWWIFGIEIISGFLWAGFEMAAVMTIYNIPAQRSAVLLGIFYAAGSLGALVGGTAGGLLVQYGFSFHSLFKFSSLLRLASISLIFAHARKTQYVTVGRKHYRDVLFTILSIRPAIGDIQRLFMRFRPPGSKGA